MDACGKNIHMRLLGNVGYQWISRPRWSIASMTTEIKRRCDLLPGSTCKVLGPALANRSCHGLDMTTEARPIASPCLTASVLAMFETRVKLLENKRGRGRVEGKPRSFVQKCKSHI